MFGVVYIPQFALQARLRLEPRRGDQPVALLEEPSNTRSARGQWILVQLSEAARRHGVRPGMTPPQAQARCPELRFLTHAPAQEEATQEALLQWAEGISPRIEATDAGVCTLDLQGTRYDDTEAPPLGEACLSVLRTLNLKGRLGIAPNPALARVAARFADPIQQLPRDREAIRQFLSRLPLSALEELSSESRTVLKRWGIRTLGELIALPYQELVERLGPAIHALRPLLSPDEEGYPLQLYRPQRDLHEAVDLEAPIDRLEALLSYLQSLLESLHQRLTILYQVTDMLYLKLTFDDGTTHEQSLEIPEPSRDTRFLLRLLRTSLEDFRAEAPVVGVALAAHPTRPATRQLDLFDSSLRDPNRFAETLAQLKALVGTTNVGTPQLQPTYRPDTFRMLSFQAGPPEESPADNVPLVSIALPLRRFRPPRPVSVQIDPAHGEPPRPRFIRSTTLQGRLVHLSGPWKSSGDWWDRHAWAREEWDIELAQGGLYRLVRQEGEWKLDGVYG